MPSEAAIRVRQAVRALFLGADGAPSPVGQVVLDHLERVCRPYATAASQAVGPQGIDPHMLGMADGRREVWELLTHHLRVSDQEFFKQRRPHDDDE